MIPSASALTNRERGYFPERHPFLQSIKKITQLIFYILTLPLKCLFYCIEALFCSYPRERVHFVQIYEPPRQNFFSRIFYSSPSVPAVPSVQRIAPLPQQHHSFGVRRPSAPIFPIPTPPSTFPSSSQVRMPNPPIANTYPSQQNISSSTLGHSGASHAAFGSRKKNQ
jgi:hypothetical protein